MSESVIRPDGPWTHRDISANGARFHIAEIGQGPLVVLLHGFPTFWWTWRKTLVHLAEAGYRAVAMDLRGYGGSDHPPHGYDPFTLSADLSGVIRSLGERQAYVIGHGWGGFVAWSAAVLEPEVIAGIIPVSMPHPRGLRQALLSDALQRRRSRYALGFQWPFLPERSLTKDGAARVGTILSDWSATPGWPDAETSNTYREAFDVWPTAHCALEYHRWALRSLPRPDGIRFLHRMEAPIMAPVLHIHGEKDPSILASSSLGSHEWVKGAYSLEILPNVGHFPHEENPEQFNEICTTWLNEK